MDVVGVGQKRGCHCAQSHKWFVVVVLGKVKAGTACILKASPRALKPGGVQGRYIGDPAWVGPCSG